MPENFPVLSGNSNPFIGARFSIDQDEFTIGRAQENNIVIGEKTVSAIHAIIRRTEHGYQLTDYNSTNGTFVNDRKISSLYLNNGDKVRFDTVEFIFQDNSSPVFRDPALSKSIKRVKPPISRLADTQPIPSRPKSKNHQKTSNGFQNRSQNLLGILLALSATWLVIFVMLFSVGSYQSNSVNSYKYVRQLTTGLPYFQTHFFYEIASDSEIRSGGVVAAGVVFAIIIGSIILRLFTHYSAGYLAFIFSLGHIVLIFFFQLLSLQFSLNRMQIKTLQVTGLQADGISALIAVYLYVFFVTWLVSAITASLFLNKR